MNELPAVNARESSIDRPPRILVVEDEAPLGDGCAGIFGFAD